MLQTVNQSNYRLQARLNLHRGIKFNHVVLRCVQLVERKLSIIIAVVSVNDSNIVKYFIQNKNPC